MSVGRGKAEVRGRDGRRSNQERCANWSREIRYILLIPNFLIWIKERAANLLSQLGYLNVYSVVDGFEGDVAATGPKQGQRVVNGWKNADLPWSYKLDKDRMYIPKL